MCQPEPDPSWHQTATEALLLLGAALLLWARKSGKEHLQARGSLWSLRGLCCLHAGGLPGNKGAC